MSLKLELKICGRNLKTQEPNICTLFEYVNNSWVQRGQTEVSKANANPDYETGVPISYFFEKNQIIKFVFRENSGAQLEIGTCETTLSALMMAKMLKFEAGLVNT